MRFVWLAIIVFTFFFGVAFAGYWNDLFLAKAPTYPFAGVGAYAGTPITAYAATSGGANHYMSFEAPVGTDYVVPVGKSLIITRLIYVGAAIGDILVIGYGDDAVGNGVSAPTTPVSLLGEAGASPTSALVVEAVNIIHTIEIYLAIPTGKYPFIQASGLTSNVQLIGVEQE